MSNTRPAAALAAMALLAAAPGRAAAQTLGTFRWQLQPYCNVITVTITQVGGTYRVEGTDDQCGGGRDQASVQGMAFANPDGTIGFGLTIVTAPGGRAGARRCRHVGRHGPAAPGATTQAAPGSFAFAAGRNRGWPSTPPARGPLRWFRPPPSTCSPTVGSLANENPAPARYSRQRCRHTHDVRSRQGRVSRRQRRRKSNGMKRQVGRSQRRLGPPIPARPKACQRRARPQHRRNSEPPARRWGATRLPAARSQRLSAAARSLATLLPWPWATNTSASGDGSTALGVQTTAPSGPPPPAWRWAPTRGPAARGRSPGRSTLAGHGQLGPGPFGVSAAAAGPAALRSARTPSRPPRPGSFVFADSSSNIPFTSFAPTSSSCARPAARASTPTPPRRPARSGAGRWVVGRALGRQHEGELPRGAGRRRADQARGDAHPRVELHVAGPQHPPHGTDGAGFPGGLRAR